MKQFYVFLIFLFALLGPLGAGAQQCDTIHVPWYEDFQTYPNSSLADCWVVNQQSAINVAQVTDQQLKITLLGYGDNIVLALPPVDLPPDSVYFRFYVNYSGNVDIVYGIMTDSTDTNTFMQIGTVPLDANSELVMVSFSTIGTSLTDTVRLAFKIHSETFSEVYFDNFYIDRAGGCSVPEWGWVDFVDTASVTLKWHCEPPFAGFAVTLNDSMQFFSPDTLIDIVGLLPNTIYDYSVRAICPGGELSPELRGTFSTSCSPVQLPFYESFQGYSNYTMPSCWRVLRGLQNYSNYTIPYVTSSIIGDKRLLFRNFSDDEIIVTTPMIAHPGNALHISFDLLIYPNTSMTVGLLYNPCDLESFVPLATFEGAEIGYSSAMNHYELFTDMVTDTSFAYVMFDWVSESNGDIGYLDNVSVEVADSCHAPSEVFYSEVGQSNITVGWLDYSISPQGYEVKFSTIDNIETADSTYFTFGSSLTFFDLETNMSYYFWVRSVCDSVWMPVGYVRTVCSQPILPYLEDFESYLEDETMPCWEYYHSDSTCGDPYVHSYSQFAQSGTKVWSFGRPFTDTVLVVLPSMGMNARNLEVSFWMSMVYGVFEAGVYDVASEVFSPVLSVIGAGYSGEVSQYMFQCDTVSAATENSRIAFRWSRRPGTVASQSSYAYIDNLRIRHIPYCHPVDSIEVLGVTDSTATLHIHDSWNTGVYRIVYTNGQTVDTAMVLGMDATLTGLQHSTNYYVEVCGYCYDGTFTDPITSMFSTACRMITHNNLPYIETFNNYTDGVHINPCWSKTSFVPSYSNYPIPYQGVFYPDSSEGVSMQFILNNSGVSSIYSQLLVLPQADYINDLYVEFDARVNNINVHVDVGVMDNPNDVSTFYPVGTHTFGTANTWTHASVPLSTYDGQGQYIAIGVYVTLSNSFISQLYIDNVKVRQLPVCSDSLTWLHVVDVDDRCATVSWSASPGINENAFYIVHLLDSAGTELYADTTADVIHTMCNLDDQTSYRVYVDLYCDSSVAATTARQIGFTTRCAMNNIVGIGASSPATIGNNLLPIYSSVPYSASEQLYYASELQNVAGTITDVNMYMTTSGSVHEIFNCTIRLGLVSDTLIRQFVPLDSLEVVYSGPMNFQHGWNTFSFERPFHINGTDNLIVSFEATSVTRFTTNNSFGVLSQTSDSASIIAYKPYDQDTIVDSLIYVSMNRRNVIRFAFCPDMVEVCQPPTITSFDATDMSITINYSSTPCEVHITQGWWNRGFTGVMDSTNSHTFEGLAPATQYTIGVRHYCSNGDRSMWTIRRITTEAVEALPPLEVEVDSVSYNTISVRWRPRNIETQWELRLFNTITDIRVVLNDTAYLFNGLTSRVTYNISVRSLCGSDFSIMSPWSDTLTVTTDYCHPVSEVFVSDISETSAHVSWTPSHNSVAWKIEYGYEGFSRGEALGSKVSYTTSTTIDSLEPGTSYDLYVATVCGPGMSSGWIGSGPFLTAGTSDITVTPYGEGFELYPNPASSIVTVKLDTDDPAAHIAIIDQHGRTVASCSGPVATIDVTTLVAGIYFVRLSGPSYSSVKKLIVN